MRSRDSQDDSKNQEKTPNGALDGPNSPDSKNEGGLFGAVQLKPADDQSGVPSPPSGAGVAPALGAKRAVPSIEEARAEFDRARAEAKSGLTPRDSDVGASSFGNTDFGNAELGDSDFGDSERNSAPNVAQSENARVQTAREAVSFGAVSLPPLVKEESDRPSDASADLVTTVEVTRPAKSFQLPSLAQFAPVEKSPGISPAEDSGNSDDSAQNVAPDAVVYAPTPIAERPLAAPNAAMSDADASEANAVDASEIPANAPANAASASRPANASNLTPFQRLMAARAAQNGPPVARTRVERPAAPTPSAATPTPNSVAVPVASPEVAVPVASPEVAAAEVAATSSLVDASAPAPASAFMADGAAMSPATTPTIAQDAFGAALGESAHPAQAPQSAQAVEQSPDAEVAQLESPVAQSSLELGAEAPITETETEGSPVAQSPQAAKTESLIVKSPEVSEANASEANAPEVESLQLEEPKAELPKSEPSEAESPQAEEQNLRVEALMSDGSANEEPAAEIVALEDETLHAPPAENAKDETALEQTEGEPTEHLTMDDEPAPTASEISEFAALESETRQPLELPNLPEASAGAQAPAEVAEIDVEKASRMAVPVSFAERLAARERAKTSAAGESPAEASPAEASPAGESVGADETDATALGTAANFAPAAPSAAPDGTPRRAAPRSFSERLAARTGLDRHLQTPTEEAPLNEELASAHTEMVRVDEGAQLSEREMRNRVLFRQKHLIFDSVIGSVEQRALQNPVRETIKPQIESGVDAAVREFNLALEPADRNWLVEEFVRETTDLGALVPMLEDPGISKIVVTGARDVSVERLGRIERTGISFRDDDHLLSLVRRIAEMSGGRVDAKVPLLDRPLPDGGRIRAKVPPLAPQPTLTIEKSTGNPFVVLKRQIAEKSRGASLPYAQLRERIQQKLLREFEGDAAALAGDQDKLRAQVEEMIGAVIAEEQVAVTRAERASLVMDLLNEIVGLGPIEPLLNDPDVDEVMVNGPFQIYVERKGKLELTSQRFRDNAHVMQVIDRIVAPLGRRVDEKSPMVDGRLRDGSRFNAIIPPLALSGPTMTIRKFARDPFTMSDLINFGSLTRESAQFLQAAVEGRLNIVVSGGTGSGKTTTLNVLSSFIPSSERIVTIEDAAELQMRQEHVIRMETRPPNIEGVGEVGIRDLVRNSLRMRPDRIVVGECRGGEALDMLQAMNTGHDGSLTTAHSNGPRDTCKRLETMVMMAGFDLPVRAIREQISMAVQLIVHQERMRDGKRRVTAITEIVGMEGDVLTMQDIFRFEQKSIDEDGRIIGSLQATGMRPKYYETIVDNGVQLSMDLFHPKPMGEEAPRARLSERGGR